MQDSPEDQGNQVNNLLQDLPMDQPFPSRDNETKELYLLGGFEERKIPTRCNEKDIIISKLVEYNEGENVMVVSIIGIGGSGKTTLAKHICLDDKIQKQFKGAIFKVHVSPEFHAKKLIIKLFEEITKEKSDVRPLSYIVHAVANKLNRKRFLLILDDAWNENRHQWEQFMQHVNIGAPGSRVLVTTRNQKVAEAVKSRYVFNLEFLKEAESWVLFLQSSEWAEQDLDSELIQLGKEIVKKCGGVPLAIKIIGGILHGNREINTWRTIRASNLWTNKDIEGQVFACLKLSYIHLENHLKECLTFCSIFPRGYGIDKDRLIGQWIAQGFIIATEEGQPEDIGSEYFDSIVKAGFLNPDGLCYKMHDLIYDLTRLILQHEVVTSLPKNIATDCTRRCRYLSLNSCNDKVESCSFQKVRAIYIYGGSQVFDKPVKKSHLVCSAILQYNIGTPFPLFILKFGYIGYLEIQNVSCTELPEAMSNCWNLHSLYLINCKGFVTLPKSIGKLKKLRTLQLDWITDLESLPQSIGDCRDLRCLQLYSCQKLTDIPNSIGKIENLRVLHIFNCPFGQQQTSEFIGELRNVEKIILALCFCFRDLPSAFASRTLHTLNLIESQVTLLPQWVTSIGTLEYIHLDDCFELVELPKDIANLKKLKVLCIQGCHKLHCMPSGIGQLTRLTQLGLFVVGCSTDDASISELENLDMISGDMKITNLKHLKDPNDAVGACLKRKNNIKNLVLDWSSDGMEEESVLYMENDLAVLNALEPPSGINMLKIIGYQSSYLPWWMRKQTDSSYCEGIMLKQTCPCQFLCLTDLLLGELPNLKHLRELVDFPLLKTFRLHSLPNLEELCTTTSMSEIVENNLGAQDCFPSLFSLFIRDCPKLKVTPCFPPFLEELNLEKSNEQLLCPSSFCHQLPSTVDEPSSSCSARSAVPRLNKLYLDGMTGSSSGWKLLQQLPALESLSIHLCNDLQQLPESVRSITSLRLLHISRCPGLGMLPEWLGELSSLEELTVSGTIKMASLPQSMKLLKSLMRLQIVCWDSLKELPEVIQHLSSLEELYLTNCSALTALPEWIGQLSALRQLHIQHCSALQSLPHSVQRLTVLQQLFIVGCPDLARRYKEGVGDDCQLISHIPRVVIHDWIDS